MSSPFSKTFLVSIMGVNCKSVTAVYCKSCTYKYPICVLKTLYSV